MIIDDDAEQIQRWALMCKYARYPTRRDGHTLHSWLAQYTE